MLDYIPHNLKPEIQDSCLQNGSTYNSACRLDRKAISAATPMFSESSNPMKLLRITSDVSRSGKSKMAAAKPEVIITQLVDQIETRYQRLSPCCRGHTTRWHYVGLYPT